ncbi:hypothetical protein D9619_001575 [Psilocybe cf. subviscida]|uniref:Carboxylic ester hydrolase n=1 Tax=Psilocybe cf. subviscida TaxID=2480587 RepID=A0A8H5BG73_9AGAR|nr:hypothetical protein D9619_001575 [Psilocybe cf. subviscida]
MLLTIKSHFCGGEASHLFCHHRRMMKTLGRLFLLAVLSSYGSAQAKNGLTVSTAQGKVAGSLVTPTVRQFLGIPYATARRWQAPQLPPKRSGTFNATSFSNTCVQSLTPGNVEFQKLAGGLGLDTPAGEDCLTVNIWAPSVSRKQKTAVLLWVFGGSFQFGTSNLPTYIGQNFVRDNDDITIVTFNYRLNIFGQPNAPQLVSSNRSQNFGLLDLDAVVQWVHDNIANFGGDPNRITIFGESAGACATDVYSFAHPTDKIVKGIIQESGNIGFITTGALGQPTLNATQWNTVASAVGCGSTANAAQFACMEAVPFQTLENAVISTGITFKLLTDNITIFADTAARASAGKFLKVPLLSGSNLNEGDIFVVAEELLTLGDAPPGITQTDADRLTEVGFTCPAGITTMQRVNAGVTTFRYQYQGVFPDISTRPDLRAYHVAEIPIVFGTYNSSTSPIGPTPDEIALSTFIQKAWVAFAINPTGGLPSIGWPKYNPVTPTLAQLGNPLNPKGIALTTGAIVDSQCANASALAAQLGSSAPGLGSVLR